MAVQTGFFESKKAPNLTLSGVPGEGGISTLNVRTSQRIIISGHFRLRGAAAVVGGDVEFLEALRLWRGTIQGVRRGESQRRSIRAQSSRRSEAAGAMISQQPPACAGVMSREFHGA